MGMYKHKVCKVCGVGFAPTTGSSACCSVECRKVNGLNLERRRDYIKRWKKAITISCGVCSVQFSTTDTKRLYCGALVCEARRCYVKNKRSDELRSGLRGEYCDVRYKDNRDDFLAYKKRHYRSNKDYEVKDGWSTEKIEFSDVIGKFKSEGYRVLSKEYANTSTKIDVVCPENHTWSVSYKSFKDTPSYIGSRCLRCSNAKQRSRPEIEIEEYLLSLDPKVNIIASDRSILEGKEVDLYLPEYSLGIEYCGLYWHGELSSGKSRGYHRKKMDLCADKGIRLITIFEDEYLNNKEAVLSRLASASNMVSRKIFARKCELKEITARQAAQFMVENHLQGKCGTLSRWGLFYKGELVQAMTLGHLTRAHAGKNCVELKRLASLKGVSVIGGASRLFKRAAEWSKNKEYSLIKSYCDMRWAKAGNTVYDTLGFKLISETKYSPHYVKGQKRYRNFSLRKTPEERLTGKTEWELRQEQGYDRIWDCGQRTYTYGL